MKIKGSNKYIWIKLIRFKIYGKSEDKLTSTGVQETNIKDAL